MGFPCPRPRGLLRIPIFFPWTRTISMQGMHGLGAGGKRQGWCLIRRKVNIGQGLCAGVSLICENIGLFHGNLGLFCGKKGFFCGNTRLFNWNIALFLRPMCWPAWGWAAVSSCAAVCCSVLQCVAVCCSVLQCAAVCCSVLQCVAVYCSVGLSRSIKL